VRAEDLRLNQNLILHYLQLLDQEQTMEFQLVEALSQFGKFNYAFSDRYLASFTIRWFIKIW
jgi:hypothetical protein